MQQNLIPNGRESFITYPIQLRSKQTTHTLSCTDKVRMSFEYQVTFHHIRLPQEVRSNPSLSSFCANNYDYTHIHTVHSMQSQTNTAIVVLMSFTSPSFPSKFSNDIAQGTGALPTCTLLPGPHESTQASSAAELAWVDSWYIE